MGQFGNILMIVIALNVFFAIFGIVEPTNNIIATLISPTSSITDFFDTMQDTLLHGATNTEEEGTSIWWTIFAAIGVGVGYAVTKRDELIYGFLIYLLIDLLGIFNFLRDLFPADVAIIGNILRIGAIVLFSWSAIEWLRGTEK